jgi:hypothetical protein
MTKQESQLQKSLLSQEQVLELEESRLKAVTAGSPILGIIDNIATIAARKRTASEAGLKDYSKAQKFRILSNPGGEPIPIFTVVDGKRVRL